jgi:predicted nucleic acid-binding protein
VYLVDTSVWIDFLRGSATPQVTALRQLLTETQPVGTAPIIVQEILQGATSPQRFKRLRRYFAEIPCFAAASPIDTHVEAARLYLRCRTAGSTPRSSNDCLIAAIAIEHGLILLHDDRDFELIGRSVPELRLYAAH